MSSAAFVGSMLPKDMALLEQLKEATTELDRRYFSDGLARINAENALILSYIEEWIGRPTGRTELHTGRPYFVLARSARNPSMIEVGVKTRVPRIVRRKGKKPKTRMVWEFVCQRVYQPVQAGLDWPGLVLGIDDGLETRISNDAIHYLSTIGQTDYEPGPILRGGGTVMVDARPVYPHTVGLVAGDEDEAAFYDALESDRQRWFEACRALREYCDSYQTKSQTRRASERRSMRDRLEAVQDEESNQERDPSNEKAAATKKKLPKPKRTGNRPPRPPKRKRK